MAMIYEGKQETMARAHNIYVVTNVIGQILAAFTVKHELITWLNKQAALRERIVNSTWLITAIGDNNPSKKVVIPIERLINNGCDD